MVFVLPLAGFLANCARTTEEGGETGSVSATSSSSGGHTHRFTIPAATLASPSGGYSASDTSSGGHTHTVTLNATQLGNIADGTSVTVTSSTDSGHSHTYTFAAA